MSLPGLQFLCLLALGSLFAVTGLRQFFVQPLEAGPLWNGLWFAVQVLPLLVLLPGVLGRRSRVLMWASLVSLLYLVHGVMAAADPATRQLGLGEMVAAVGLLAASLVMVRRLPGGGPPAP